MEEETYSRRIHTRLDSGRTRGRGPGNKTLCRESRFSLAREFSEAQTRYLKLNMSHFVVMHTFLCLHVDYTRLVRAIARQAYSCIQALLFSACSGQLVAITTS